MQTTSQIKMAEWIKSIDKKDIAYDAEGRLLIRALPENKIFLKADHLVADNIYSLANVLLHPTDRIVHESITIWAIKLLNKWWQTISLTDSVMRAGRLAEIYNNAALIFFSIGEVEKARELCYAQIHLFIKRFSQYTFQPWINLSRMDRVLGHYEDALNKLQSLEKINYSALEQENLEIAEAVKTCVLLEPIKTYLQMQQYQKALDFIEEKSKQMFCRFDTFLLEARAVALANLNRSRDALVVLRIAKANVSPVVMPVFILRECELHHDMVLIEKLYSHILLELKTNKANGNTILFSQHLARILQDVMSFDSAIQVLAEGFALAKAMNDEVLMADCLVALYELSGSRDREQLEKSMIELYCQTQYINTKKKLKNCLPLLAKLSVNHSDTALNDLYQQLMMHANVG